MFFFKDVILAPLIATAICFPLIFTINALGLFDSMNSADAKHQAVAVVIGLGCAFIGLVVGYIIQFRYT